MPLCKVNEVLIQEHHFVLPRFHCPNCKIKGEWHIAKSSLPSTVLCPANCGLKLRLSVAGENGAIVLFPSHEFIQSDKPSKP